MRTLLSERGTDYVPPDSGLEARFLSVLRSASFPEPVRQLEAGRARWVGRADRRRDCELVEAGYRVLRITDDQVWYRPREVVAAVRSALATAAA